MIETLPNCIMNNAQAQEKLYRMGLQIQEDALNGVNIALVGLNKRGFFIANILHNILLKECSVAVSLVNIIIDNSVQNLPTALQLEVFANKQIIIIDDVANTGRSFAYAMHAILPCEPASIKTLALVERSHKLFPIKINYKGLVISTTLQEHITVKIGDDGNMEAFLN